MDNSKGLQDENYERPLPPRPTKAIPGTEAKIRVLEWRVLHDYAPHHPDDFREDKDPV